jgi:hypothetical protein
MESHELALLLRGNLRGLLKVIIINPQYPGVLMNERKLSHSTSIDGVAKKDDSTWTDAADKAQDSLNDNEAVSKKDADDMNEHSAA